MFCLIDPSGKMIRAKTSKKMAELTGLRPSHIRSLNCGYFQTLQGYVSTHKNAAKRRKRIFTRLVNLSTGEKCLVGRSVAALARHRGWCVQEVYDLLNRRQIAYRGWVVESTYQAAQAATA